MALRERKLVEEPTLRWATSVGIGHLKMNLQGNTGWPDDLFLGDQGRMAFIEFKAPGEELKRNQPARVAELKQRGIPVGVFDDPDKARAFLEATLLPGGRRRIDDFAGVRGFVVRPRDG